MPSLAHTGTDLAPRPRARPIIAFDARYVNDQYHGIGRHAFNLLESLTRLDPNRQYAIYINPHYPNHRFDWSVLAARPNVALRPTALPLYSPIEQIFWPVELARVGARLFHSPYVAVPVLASVPIVMTVHDLILERFPMYMPRPRLRHLHMAATQVGIWRAARVLTVSGASRDDIVAFYRVDQRRITVIGNAVDCAFTPVADPVVLGRVRDRYQLPPHFVLSLGAGRPHKNLEVLVDAFARLADSTAVTLVIAGEADPRFPDGVSERIRTYALQHRVLRPGHIREPDLPAVYSLADVLVFPSLVEGFGLPPLEAMACGTPVIASRSSVIPEVVGGAALAFDPLDGRELARLLQRVLCDSDLHQRLSDEGRVRARQFSWDHVARQTLGVYSNLLSPGG